MFFLILMMIPDIEFDSVIRVIPKNNNVQVGTLFFQLSADDFFAASVETPVYIEIAFGNSITLANTLAQGTNIALALRVNNSGYLYETSALPCSAQIVRAIAGETSLWIRIQTASNTWLQNTSTGFFEAPNPYHTIDFRLGITGPDSKTFFNDHYLVGEANMPSNQINNCESNPGLNSSVSTQIFLNVNQTCLVEDDLVTFYTWTGYASGVEDAPNPSGISKDLTYPMFWRGTKAVAKIAPGNYGPTIEIWGHPIMGSNIQDVILILFP